MRFQPTSLALVLCAATSACVIAGDSSLHVRNRSDFVISEMYVTPIDNPSWGPDLLGGEILFPGDSMYLSIDCGTYDAMLIDETGAICEARGIELCFDDAEWIIRNNTCNVFDD